jgi:hypothetical protein
MEAHAQGMVLHESIFQGRSGGPVRSWPSWRMTLGHFRFCTHVSDRPGFGLRLPGFGG